MTAYLYRPITMYQGKVLKCVSIATDSSRRITQARANGTADTLCRDDGLMENGVVVETPEYLGDRIHADTLKPFHD